MPSYYKKSKLLLLAILIAVNAIAVPAISATGIEKIQTDSPYGHKPYPIEPFILAMKENNIPYLKKLLSGAYSGNYYSLLSSLALIWAIENRDDDVTKIAIEYGASVEARFYQNDNTPIIWGYTPLIWALHERNYSGAKILMENGANVLVKNYDGDSALMWAARNGNIEWVNLLLEKCHHECSKNFYGDTALMWAVGEGHEKVVKLLIRSGADVNALNYEGDTARSIAVRKGYTKIERVLTDVGALGARETTNRKVVHSDKPEREYSNTSKSKYDQKHSDALTGILEFSNTRMSNIRFREPGSIFRETRNALDMKANPNVKYYGTHTPLALAVMIAHLDIVKMLLANGADINLTGNYGKSPLAYAIESGSIDMVKLLLEKGADVNMMDSHGMTPLSLICSQPILAEFVDKSVEIARLLLEYGARPNSQNHYGKMALTAAVISGRSEIVKMLLDNGADVNSEDNYGIPALAIAKEEIAKILVERGADVNMRDSKTGETLLMSAAMKHFDSNTKLLIENGADIDAIDKNGNTALMLAAQSCRVEQIEILVASGATIHVHNKYGYSALMYANLCDKFSEKNKASQPLMEAGAFLTKKDRDLISFLEAINNVEPELVSTLLSEKKVAANVMNWRGDKAIHLVMYGAGSSDWLGDSLGLKSKQYRDYMSIVQSLVESGADLNAQDTHGNTALMIISSGKNENILVLDLIDLLIENGANPNLKGYLQQTALIGAANKLHFKSFERLIDKGANVNAKDSHGYTALMSMASYGRYEYVKLLIDNGAKVNARNNNGQNALELAGGRSARSIVDLLIENGSYDSRKVEKAR